MHLFEFLDKKIDEGGVDNNGFALIEKSLDGTSADLFLDAGQDIVGDDFVVAGTLHDDIDDFDVLGDVTDG